MSQRNLHETPEDATAFSGVFRLTSGVMPRNHKLRVHYRGYFYPAPVVGKNVVTKCGIKVRWPNSTDASDEITCLNCRLYLMLDERAKPNDRHVPSLRPDLN